MILSFPSCRTIRRVIIDLTQHPRAVCCMKYAAVFVAMSRVATKDHIRLLEKSTIGHRSSLYDYISTLAPESHIAPFLYGYSTEGAPWDPSRCLSYSKIKQKQ